jgi:hypothetical protein
MLSRRALLFCSVVALLAVALAGCSDSYGGRMAIAGAVKLAGEPLDGGQVMFFPLDGQDTQGGAPVVNGEYKIDRKHGLKPGKYLVRLTAGDGKTPANEEAGGPGGSTNIVSVDRIPDDWNTHSTQKIEVKAKGPNTFDFDIPNVNPRARRP